MAYLTVQTYAQYLEYYGKDNWGKKKSEKKNELNM